jgi:uncharacterized SAM-binding protein YcdF (DUF218 family)
MKFSLVGLLLVFLLGAALFTFYAPLLTMIGDHLIVKDDLHPASVIHVISGLDYRTDYAIQLYRAHLGDRLFFTGGWCDQIQGNHAERGRDLALRAGIPAQAISIDGSQVTSTYAEAVRLKKFIDESPQDIRSVMVVSDPYHMRRARWTYHKVLGDRIDILMAPVPFEKTPYLRAWWTDGGSITYVKNEYQKMAYYYARYQLARGSLQAWLASLDQE